MSHTAPGRSGRLAGALGVVSVVAFLLAAGAPSAPAPGNVVEAVPASSVLASDGYWLTTAAGDVSSFGSARPAGPNRNLGPDIVAAAAAPGGGGYWHVDSDGDVFAYGSATDHGSRAQNADDVVGFAARSAGDGYWMVASDGGVFAFGAAPFAGSAGATRLNRPVVGMAATPNGAGYWLVASDGGIFTYGDARFWGSTGSLRLNQPIVGMAATPSGAGYWLVASDGGIFAFGDARFWGSTGDLRLNQPIVAAAPTGTGGGYWLAAADGGLFAFGDARFLGSDGERRLTTPVVSITATPPVLIDAKPEAAADAAGLDEDGEAVIDVLANDRGLGDGGVVVTVTAAPAHGSVSIGAGWRLGYDPVPDWNGSDSFTYQVSDIDGDTSTAVVTVTVGAVNDAPVLTGQALVTPEDTPVGGKLAVADVDQDTLTYSVSAAAQGAVVIDPATGGFAYTPTLDATGTDSFTVSVADGHGGSTAAVVTVEITPVDDVPVLLPSSPPALSLIAGALSVPFTFSVADVDTPGLVPTVLSSATAVEVDVPAAGVAPGTWTVNLTPAHPGDAVVTIAVGDGTTTVSVSFTVVVSVQ